MRGLRLCAPEARIKTRGPRHAFASRLRCFFHGGWSGACANPRTCLLAIAQLSTGNLGCRRRGTAAADNRVSLDPAARESYGRRRALDRRCIQLSLVRNSRHYGGLLRHGFERGARAFRRKNAVGGGFPYGVCAPRVSAVYERRRTRPPHLPPNLQATIEERSLDHARRSGARSRKCLLYGRSLELSPPFSGNAQPERRRVFDVQMRGARFPVNSRPIS